MIMKPISLFNVFMADTVPEKTSKVLMSGQITQGPIVEQFEKELGEYLGNERVLTLNSATAGLTLALRLLNTTETDIVLSCPLTCFATNAAILANHCKIGWVDVDMNTGNMCMNDLKNKLSEHTKVICVVHFGGNAIPECEMDEIKEYSKIKFGFKPMIVEDCAHTFGAKYPDTGRMVGSSNGNIQVFSLQAIKLLTTGDGGLIVLPTSALLERARLLRWYGIPRGRHRGKDFRLEDDIPEYGYKFHMNDIAASIGIENLKHVDRLLELNRKNGAYLQRELKKIKGIESMNVASDCSSFWLYTVKIERKEAFIEFMKERDIMVSQVHARNDPFTCLKESVCHLPVLDELEKTFISLPVGYWLDQVDISRMVGAIRDFLMIRPLTPNDYHMGYLDLINTFTQTPEHKTFNEFCQVYMTNNSSVFVIEMDSRIIGSISIHKLQKFHNNFKKVAHIEDVVVLPEYKNQGIGSKLVQYAIDFCKSDCYKTVLTCNENNISFYKRLGFVVKGTELNIYN